MASERTIVRTDDAPAAVGPYSQAVAAGGLLFTAGQIALRPDGTLVEGDVAVQARQVMQNLKAVLEAGGSGLDRIVKTTCFLRDMDDYAAFNEVYAEFVGSEPPARSAVEVARLPKDVAVEVEAVGVL